MLKKLIKYDLKDLFNVSYIFYILVFIMALICNLLENFGDNILIIYLFSGFIELGLIVLLISLIAFSFFKIVSKFYNDFYTDEAYLTHTLPVSRLELFLSKFISSIIYLITSFLVIIVNYVIGLSLILTNKSCFIKSLNTIDGCYSSNIISYIEDTCIILITSIWLIIISIFVLIALEFITLMLSSFLGTIYVNLKNRNNKKIKSIVLSIIIYLLTQLFIILVLYVSSKFYPPINDLFTMNIFKLNLSNEKIKLIKILYFVIVGLYLALSSLLFILANKSLKKGINID